MATLTIENLSKTYGRKQALTNVNIDIADGEFFCMLGPSGAGKTTTLKSIAGLQEIDSGVITIGGVDMTGVEPYHRNVGMAFESYALYPQKTLFENLASPLRSGRSGKFSDAEQKERIDAVTTTLGVAHLQARLPKELSNGQRQRVALGRVLVRPADVYLLDEPLSHLDAKLRAAMRAELKRLSKISSTTTVYVTHDYQEALSLGDRIGVLKAGELIQVGTPQEVWMRPLDTFVARSLGQPEMNLFDAELVNGELVALGGALRVRVPADVALGGTSRARLGLRPSDLHATHGTPPAGVGPQATFNGRVELAERLGRQIELSVRVGDADVIVISDGTEHLEEGEPVTLTIPLWAVHIFAGADDPGADTVRLGAAGEHVLPAHAMPATAARGTAPGAHPVSTSEATLEQGAHRV